METVTDTNGTWLSGVSRIFVASFVENRLRCRGKFDKARDKDRDKDQRRPGSITCHS